MRRPLVLVASHLATLMVGIATGIYLLPILIAPPAPTDAQVRAASVQAPYSGHFRRDLPGSDSFHWGNGTVSVGPASIALEGRISPGPDYKLYLSPEYVETEADFARHRPRMVRVGEVRTFRNFIVPLPANVDPSAFNTVIVWCESFGQFITAARYR